MAKDEGIGGTDGTGGAGFTSVSASGGSGVGGAGYTTFPHGIHVVSGGAVSTLPYVEEHEEPEARALIDKQFIELTGKKLGYRPAGYFIACKIYVSPDEMMEIDMPDGSKKTLYTAPVTQQQDVLKNVAALVCAVGPEAYKGFNPDGTKRFPHGPWCRVADWVCIPRSSSFLFQYRGVAMAVLSDDKILGVIEDPRDVSEIYVAPKI